MPHFVRSSEPVKSILFLIFMLLFSPAFLSQEPSEEPPALQIKQFKHSIKLGAGLPVIISNEPFRESMDGVYSVQGQADFSIYKPVTAGLYYGYAMFDNAELKGNKGRRADVTKGFFSTAGASLGYEKFIDENKLLSISVNSGYSWIRYKLSISFTDTVSNLHRTEAFNLGLTAGYSLIIEETGGIGFYASYKYIDTVFNPAHLGFSNALNDNKTHLLTLGILFLFGY